MSARVLHVVSAPGFLGAAHQAALLARELPAGEFEGHLCLLAPSSFVRPPAPFDSDVPPPWAPFDPERVTTTACRWRWDPLAVWNVRKLMQRLRPDLIHAWQLSALACACLAAPSIPRLVTFRREEPLLGRALSIVLRRLANCAAAPVVSCDALLARFRDAGLELKNPRVVHSAVPIAPSVSTEPLRDPRAELEIPADAPLIVGLGAMTAAKRWRDALFAMEVFTAVYPQAHLVIVGAGEQFHTLNSARCATLRHDHVHLLSACDPASLLDPADFFWHPAGETGHSVALLQAMAAGVPVVAADVPGIRDLVIPGRTGALVPVADPIEFTRATHRLMRDRAAAKAMGLRGRQHLAENFSAQKLVATYRDQYRSLLEARG